MRYAIIAVLVVFLCAGQVVAAPSVKGENNAGLGLFIKQVIWDLRIVVTDLAGSEQAKIAVRAAAIRDLEKEPYASQKVERLAEQVEVRVQAAEAQKTSHLGEDFRKQAGILGDAIDIPEGCRNYGGEWTEDQDKVGCFDMQQELDVSWSCEHVLFSAGKARCEALGGSVICDTQNVGCVR